MRITPTVCPRLMEMYDIETLIMPEERGDALYEEIVASAAKHGTEVITAKGDMTVTCGGIGMEIYAYLNGGENERCPDVKAHHRQL